MFPFIVLGRLWSLFKPLKEEYELFFFFPFYTIGGAEKVHTLVADTFKDKKAIIFFTRKSQNDLLLPEFKKTGFPLKDISRYTDNKWIYFMNLVYRGIITGYINRQRLRPLVFNGQCNFAYKIAPWVNNNIAQVELIHSFCSFSYIRMPFLPFYRFNIMISRKAIADHLALYRRYLVPARFNDKIVYIPNGIPITPPHRQPAAGKEQITVLYVGRGTREKRVHLVAQMAEACAQNKVPARFEFLGDVREAIPASLHRFCKFYGNQNDPTVIEGIYNTADILLITSSTEGLPLVIMEAMSKGLAVIATAVGDIPFVIKDHENGFVIPEINNEQVIVATGAGYIELLSKEKQLASVISENNIRYAQEHFDIEVFRNKYRQLFQELN